MIALSIICVALAGLLAYEKRQNGVREKEWALERGALLQRIQAPERAAAEHAGTPARESVPVVPLDDDEAFAKLREDRNGDS